MAMPCSHPDLFIDDWLEFIRANEKMDEFDIIFDEYEEVLELKKDNTFNGRVIYALH